MALDFSYNKFYIYYTKIEKYEIDKHTRNPIYFYKNNKHNREPYESNTSFNYILINDVKVYVTPYKNDKNKKILFTIPTEHNGQLYDYHYHFGIRKLNTHEENTEVDDFHEMNVFFHKTIQIPDGSSNLVLPEGKKLHIECYFQDNIKIKKIKDILCMNESGILMENQFTDEELSFIDEIIRRPFNENKYKHQPKKLKTHSKRKNSRKKYTEKKEPDPEKYEKIFEKNQIVL